MKTRQPLVLTACIAEADLTPFDLLRKQHFPPGRNFLAAHLTMFHRLPGEYAGRILADMDGIARRTPPFAAAVSGLRHLGEGVAYSIESPALEDIRALLKTAFGHWLGSQDRRLWQPHITIQNRASKPEADALHAELSARFQPRTIGLVGLDLWHYRGGPWQQLGHVPFTGSLPWPPQASA